MMSSHNQKGFSLVELLISLAISAIIIGAAFGSYMIVARNYEFQKDMKYISQSARAVVKLINNDIRMAGYKNDTNATIGNAITLTDSGANCCDAIEIIYDKSATDRYWIKYWTVAYPTNQTDRYRLYKRIRKCTNAACTTFAATDVLPQNPVADYVEDLQFSGTRNGVTAGTGAEEWGQGNIREISPSNATSICEDPVTNVNGGEGALSASGSAINAIDGSLETVYSCHSSNPQSNWANFGFSGDLDISFDKVVRLTEIRVWFSPHIDMINGSRFFGTSSSSWEEPYAKYRPFNMGGSTIYINPHHRIVGNNCTFDPAVHPGGCNTAFKWESMSGEINSDGYIQYEPNMGWVSNLYYQINKGFTIKFGHQNVCDYSIAPPSCTLIDAPYREISEITFRAEVYGEPQLPFEVEISVLLRSPNEHGNVDRANSWNSKVDKYLRDSYTTSSVIRNLFYQSQ